MIQGVFLTMQKLKVFPNYSSGYDLGKEILNFSPYPEYDNIYFIDNSLNELHKI
ncbi:MAG: hypothetical protein CM15mP65_26500 [Crocinitomicaceae bacterium]|nr:MAG: hypothetical protein CM15mP65_26500 [Crocinitomicaceae bacterium]